METNQTSDRAASAARLPRDFVIGLALLAFVAVAYWVTFGFDKAPAAVAQNVQPATFPRMVLGTIAVFALFMMAMSYRRDSEPGKRVPLMVPLTAASMIAFVIAFDIFGIIVAMALYCLIMPIVWGERRLTVIIPFAVLFPAAIYGLFAKVLSVHFDAGIFGF